MAARKKAGAAAQVAGPQQPSILHDLLDEPVFRVRDGQGAARILTLPGVLAALGGASEIESFTGLQAHQTHPWHAFLVQLAAIALHRAGEESPALDEAAWKERLLALTEGAHEPWALVVGDLAKAAFLQPPVPEGSLAEWKEDELRPDEIDLLITSKNHDVKAARLERPRPDHWAYVLVCSQTMEGYSGRANYGIARMKDVYASRPGISVLPGLAWSARFRRELAILLARRADVVEQHEYAESGGVALLWAIPWSGAKRDALTLRQLDPFFIEVCRRRRLAVTPKGIRARETGTEGARIVAEELLGRTGDPWTPLDREEGGAYRPKKVGFPYEEATELLLGQAFEPSATQRIQRADPAVVWLGLWSFVRGQGKTEGLHERLISLPAKVRGALATEELRNTLADRARARVKRASEVSGGVLRPALKVLLQAGPEKLKMEDDRPQRWTQAFNKAVDDIFFPALFDDLEKPGDAAEGAFDARLLELAREQLEAAIAGAPLPAARRPRAIAAAERAFRGCARKVLPNLTQTPAATPAVATEA